jgi:hypothetical protein
MLRFCLAAATAAAAAAAAFRSKKSSPIHHPTSVTCNAATAVGVAADADREGQLLSSTDGSGETAATSCSTVGSNHDGAAGTAASSSSPPQMTSPGTASVDGLSSEYAANW